MISARPMLLPVSTGPMWRPDARIALRANIRRKEHFGRHATARRPQVTFRGRVLIPKTFRISVVKTAPAPTPQFPYRPKPRSPKSAASARILILSPTSPPPPPRGTKTLTQKQKSGKVFDVTRRINKCKKKGHPINTCKKRSSR